MALSSIQIDSLNTEERLELIEALWESLGDERDRLPVPESHKRILDKRLDEIDSGDDDGIPWDEVKTRILSRLK